MFLPAFNDIKSAVLNYFKTSLQNVDFLWLKIKFSDPSMKNFFLTCGNPVWVPEDFYRGEAA